MEATTHSDLPPSIPYAGPRVVLFCGGRDCTDDSHGAMIRADIYGLERGSVVLHGGARGADLIADYYARRVAEERELHVARVDALWEVYGRSAGPRRNRAMTMLNPTFAFAYPTGGPGTAGMIELLQEARVPVCVREARRV